MTWWVSRDVVFDVVFLSAGGTSIKAVSQVSKTGFTYVFDRLTGEPVWPIEERLVPPSAAPGGGDGNAN